MVLFNVRIAIPNMGQRAGLSKEDGPTRSFSLSRGGSRPVAGRKSLERAAQRQRAQHEQQAAQRAAARLLGRVAGMASAEEAKHI